MNAEVKESLEGKDLVNALRENHATEKILQIGDRIGLEGEGEIVELLPPPLVLLLHPLLLLAVGGPRPPHPPL